MALPSKSASREERKAIQAEAAAWVVRLDADPTEAVLARANAWIDADPRHGAAFAEAELAWEQSCHVRLRDGELVDEAGSPSSSTPLLQRPLTRRAAGVGLLAASAIGALGLARQFDLFADRHRTGRGEQSMAKLADGSSIALNTETIIDVRLESSQRLVKFIKGEALFDVTRDVNRPFIVDLGFSRVEVLGTSFNIRKRQDRVELTVTHGVVSVTTGAGQSARVKAGETTLIRPDLLATTDLDQPLIQQRVAWQDGFIELNGETLEQAVAEFNRYREQPIVIGDPRVAQLEVSGRFGIHESAAFLKALSQSFDISTQIEPGGALVLRGGKAAHASAT